MSYTDAEVAALHEALHEGLVRFSDLAANDLARVVSLDELPASLDVLPLVRTAVR